MSGHNKWSTIKHKKGAADAKRGKIFTRLIKELTVSARDGGGDADSNPRLRTVIAEAKAANMPADNIKRAIQRGTGESSPASRTKRSPYEGYGPGGAAIIHRGAHRQQEPDASARSATSSRSTAGTWARANASAWMFDKKGYIVVEKRQGRRGRV